MTRVAAGCRVRLRPHFLSQVVCAEVRDLETVQMERQRPGTEDDFRAGP
jgi:hypothetical protein